MSARKKPLIGLALTLGLLVLADVAVGRFLIRGDVFRGYALPPFGAVTNPKQERWLERVAAPAAPGTRLFRFDAELGWSHHASAASEDGLYTTNALAARGRREYAPAPPAGVTRVACYGDSFTMGVDVADGEDYPAQLERLVPDFEALNFGVGGYGTGQALLRFRRLGRFEAEHVAIGILLENVGRNVNRYRPLWYPQSSSAGTKPRFRLVGEQLVLVPQPYASLEQLTAAVRDGSVIERIAEHEYWHRRPAVPTGRLSSIARLLFANSAIQARKPERLWRDEAGEPFRVTVAVLEAFHREALASGARTAPVLIFPTREALASRCADAPRFWEGLRRALEQRGVPYLDLTDPLAEFARREHGGDANPLYTNKNHLTGPANEVVAVALHERLTAERP